MRRIKKELFVEKTVTITLKDNEVAILMTVFGYVAGVCDARGYADQTDRITRLSLHVIDQITNHSEDNSKSNT